MWLQLGVGTIEHSCISATAQHSQLQPCSWWFYTPHAELYNRGFPIDPSKIQRNNNAQLRRLVLQCWHLHPRRYKLVLYVRLEIISIFLYFCSKENIPTSLRVELNHLLCQPESLQVINQDLHCHILLRHSLMQRDAIGSSVYGVNRDSITSVSFSLSVFSSRFIFPCVWCLSCRVWIAW